VRSFLQTCCTCGLSRWGGGDGGGGLEVGIVQVAVALKRSVLQQEDGM
jgi:hypothetical protein